MLESWKDLKQFVMKFYTTQFQMLGSLHYLAPARHHFFAPTLSGQRSYVRDKLLLEKKIQHNGTQRMDLSFVRPVIHIDWYSIHQELNQCMMSFRVTTNWSYGAYKQYDTKISTYHQMRLLRLNGTWYIEEDLYQDEFERVSFDKERKKTKKRQLTRNDPTPMGVYNRDKAVAYARKHAFSPNNDGWGYYGKLGGDCTNFVSQCLYAGGIPFDHVGRDITEQWYWYSERHRTPSWTSANALKNYMLKNKGVGIVASLVEFEALEPGDLIQLGTLEQTTHSMIVVDKVYKEGNGELLDVLVAQHSVEGGIFGDNIPLASKPPKRLYYKIYGYNPQMT